MLTRSIFNLEHAYKRGLVSLCVYPTDSEKLVLCGPMAISPVGLGGATSQVGSSHAGPTVRYTKRYLSSTQPNDQVRDLSSTLSLSITCKNP
jgi:hypothetical protein